MNYYRFEGALESLQELIKSEDFESFPEEVKIRFRNLKMAALGYKKHRTIEWENLVREYASLANSSLKAWTDSPEYIRKRITEVFSW